MKFKYSAERKWIASMLSTIKDVYGGNQFIRANSKSYLRQAPAEDDESYKRRRESSVFYNFFKPIIRLAAERPFKNEVTYSENFPEQLEFVKNNIDGLGGGLLFRAFETFSDGLRDGSVGIVPDYDNEKKAPFIRIIPAEDIIGLWKKMNEDGSYYYERAQFIVRSTEIEEIFADSNAERIVPDDFKEYERTKIIELIHPNIMRTWIVNKKEVAPIVQGEIDLSKSTAQNFNYDATLIDMKELDGFERIPFHLFKTEKTVKQENTIQIIPSFYDLALLNLSHYNKQSDQDNILTVSRYAILCASGVSEEDIERSTGQKEDIRKKKIIGPFTLLFSENESSKFYYCEHGGEAIEAGMNDIIKTEKAMTSLLTDYLQRQVIQETATEKNIQERNQTLYTIYLANRLERIFGEVFKDFATFLGIDLKEEDSLISFSRDYSAADTASKIGAIQKAREMGDIDGPTYLNELNALSVFSPQFNPAKAAEDALTESANALANNPLPDDDPDPLDDE